MCATCDHEVIIVGGGIVGSTLACALLQGGMHVALVEALPLDPPPLAKSTWLEEFDLRVFALTRASERIFTNLDVWEAIRAYRVSTFQQMCVWDAHGSGAIHFDCAALVESALGHIVEHKVLLSALTMRLAEFSQLTWYRPAKVTQFTRTADRITVHLDNGHSLKTRLLVSAEGANASIRTLAGIPYNLHDYAQQAIVATVRTELPHGETAWQRFLPTGPLAFLPLTEPDYCSIVWSVDTPQVARLMALDSAAFEAELTQAFAAKLGNVVASSQRAAFTLQRRHALQYVQSRIALVGDAAHTVHPLAGQGVNLGLLDAAALSEVLLEAFASGRDCGDYTILRRYERWRKGHNFAVQTLMDGFKYLFSRDIFPWPWLRNFGLNFTDSNEWVKRLIMQQAMGVTGDLPRLAQFPLTPP